MEKEILTSDESALLKAFDNAPSAFVPELAVSARLTPVEANRAVNSLQAKELITLEDEKVRIVRLTPKGARVREGWPVEPQKSSSNNLQFASPGSLDQELQKAIEELSR
jgi:DNA-binding MarR family transcriptional regulator